MKNADIDLNAIELRKRFSPKRYASKADLEKFYDQLYPNLTYQDFRRILYSLEKQNMIASSGRGIYAIQSSVSTQNTLKKRFVPTLSQNIKEISDELQDTFPYLHFLAWDTIILHEFMLHQPAHHDVIIETEKGSEDSIFNKLSEKSPGKTFLNPDRIMMERYVLQQSEAILISKLITQTPVGRKVNGVPYAKIEKILVDILVDDEKYFIFQGQELVSIYENVFDRYLIDEKSMLRYAGRRKAIVKLKHFILSQTQIELMQFDGDSH